MLTSQKVTDAINEPAFARLRRGRQIDLHRRDYRRLSLCLRVRKSLIRLRKCSGVTGAIQSV